MTFNFNPKNHSYTLDGKRLTGCTTILNVVAKPALIPWAANMTADYLREKWTADKPYKQSEISEMLEDARKAHTRRKETAGDWGKITHKLIEEWIKTKKTVDEVELDDGKKYKVAADNKKALKTFIKWAEDNKVKFLESEKVLYSEKLWLGGTVDFVCEIDGKIWIGDLKTAKSGIYPENFWQCAGYGLMLKEMGVCKDFMGYTILNIKQSGEFDEKRNISIKDNEDVFLACLKIYRIKEKIKSDTLNNN